MLFTNSLVRGDELGEGGRRMTIVGGLKRFNDGYVGRDWIFVSWFSWPILSPVLFSSCLSFFSLSLS